MENKKIGFALTGSHCTLEKAVSIMQAIAQNNEVYPIFSYSVSQTSTRFFQAEGLKKKVEEITKKSIISTIAKAEPIGPQDFLDIK